MSTEDESVTTPSGDTPEADAIDSSVTSSAADGSLDAPDDDLWAEPDSLGGMPRKKAVRLAQIGLVVVVLLVIGMIVLSQGGDDDATSPDAKGEDTEQAEGEATGEPDWPRTVFGRPPGLGTRGEGAADIELTDEAAPGVYVWNDYDGWHLWAVAGEGVPAINGTITSNDAVAKAELAVAGAGAVSVAEKVVTFSLPAEGPITGIDFNPGFYGKQLVFTINGPDGPVDATKVWVGAKPNQAPFPLVISKEPQG